MKSQVLSLAIPRVLLSDARQVAERSGMKQSQVLREAIRTGMIPLRDRWVHTPSEKDEDNDRRIE